MELREKRTWSYLNTGTIVRFSAAVLLLVGYVILRYLFMTNLVVADTLAETAKVIALVLSGAMSYLDFAVAELLLYVLLMCLCIYIVFIAFRIVTTGRWVVYLLRCISTLCLWGTSLLVIFMLLFGVQYHSTTLADKMDLEVRPRSVEELIEVTEAVLKEANFYSTSVLRDDYGDCNYGSFEMMATWIGTGYEKLGEDYPVFKSSYAPAKSVKSWMIMSMVGVAGIYVPFTGEALVNPDTPTPGIVFDMAHEVAHRLGVALEDEANFAAYMACKSHSDRRVRYAGYFMAFRYLFNALYAVDPQTGNRLWSEMTPELLHDMELLNANIELYEGPVRDFGDKVNDTYLKVNGQEDGVKSYGQMVDLVMAEYFRETEE